MSAPRSTMPCWIWNTTPGADVLASDARVERGAHEGRVNAAAHAKLVAHAEVLRQAAVGDATVHLGRDGQLGELHHRRVDDVQRGAVAVAEAEALEAAHKEGKRRLQPPQHAVVLEVHWARVQARAVELFETQPGLLEAVEATVDVGDLRRELGGSRDARRASPCSVSGSSRANSNEARRSLARRDGSATKWYSSDSCC